MKLLDREPLDGLLTANGDQSVVLDVDEAPLDYYDPEAYPDGDDTVYSGLSPSLLRGSSPTAYRRGPALNRPISPRARIVPPGREIKLMTRGRDTVAPKRALAVWANHAGHPEWFPWRKTWVAYFGPRAVRALRRFQSRHNLDPDGVYGPATHRLLAPFYDSYGARLLQQYPKATPRQKIVAEALWGYHNRYAIHYAQWRPIDGHRHPRKLPLYTDCSGFATDAYEWAHQGDPNGFGFNGLGYTGTLLNHGVTVPSANAHAGDLAFYGWNRALGTAAHVAVLVSPTRIVSLGSEIGPLLLPLDYRSDRWAIRSYIPVA